MYDIYKYGSTIAAPEAKSYESNISVYGKVDASREGDSVSILMYDDDAAMEKIDRVLHLGMTEVKAGGHYQYKFKYTMPAGKTLANYTLKAKIGADDITDTIVSVEENSINAFDASIRMDAYFTPEVTITNTGVGGDTVNMVLDRYDWDISRGNPNIVYLICGGNDVNYWEYTVDDPYIDAGKINEIEKCLTSYDKFIATMREEGLDMVLLGCAPYDEVNYLGAITSGEDYHQGSNAAFKILNTKLNEKVAALETKDDVSRIDFFNYVGQISADARKEGPNAKALAKGDRIHLEDYGYFVEGALILLAQGNDEVVSTVDIDVADADNATIKNAVVNVTEATSSKVAYTYDPNSLLLGLCQWYKDAEKFYPVTEKLNQEIIKKAGLEEGTYTITFTGEDDVVYTIGSYTNTELAKGVNIATNEYNPGQIQAAAAMAKQVARRTREQNVCSMVADRVKAGTQRDPEFLAIFNAGKDEALAYAAQAKVLSTPKTYEVVIEKN